MPRLVLASDTHNKHAALDVPAGDIFIHAGDFTMDGNLRDVAAFGEWVRSLPHAHKIVIAGNHDLTFERDPKRARRALGDGLTYLQDSGASVAGLAVWGSPWQPWFYDWAFNLRRGPELEAKWALIPEGTDVLITHGPPMNVLDYVPRGAKGAHVGCEMLSERVRELAPAVHVFGHIHEGSGVERLDGTTYVNASICDAAYRAVNPVRVVDL
jgi:predicted phosphodiesterase